jgi:hypothetical protein
MHLLLLPIMVVLIEKSGPEIGTFITFIASVDRTEQTTPHLHLFHKVYLSCIIFTSSHDQFARQARRLILELKLSLPGASHHTFTCFYSLL